MDHDLTFVAPDRRAEVQRRIAVIESFMKKPGRKAAEAATAQLGLHTAQFYNLVRAWRSNKRADAIAGSGGPRSRRSGMTPLQLELIEQTVALGDRTSTKDIVDQIIRRAECDGVDMPDRGTLTRMVRRTRPGLLPEEIKTNYDLIIDHTVLDLAVDFDEIAPRRPLATMVIDVACDAIVGIAMSSHIPTAAATAVALLDAMQRGVRRDLRPIVAKPRVGIVAGPLDDTAALQHVLESGDFEVSTRLTGPHGGGKIIEALLGSRHAGIRMKPRLVWNQGNRRIIMPEPGSRALGPHEAAELARGRLRSSRATLVFGGLSEGSRLRIANGLSALAQGGTEY